MAVGKVQPNLPHPAKHYLFKHREPMGEIPVGLEPLQDYTDLVDRPAWLADCQPRYVTPLSTTPLSTTTWHKQDTKTWCLDRSRGEAGWPNAIYINLARDGRLRLGLAVGIAGPAKGETPGIAAILTPSWNAILAQ
jgi:hypothetical protein